MCLNSPVCNTMCRRSGGSDLKALGQWGHLKGRSAKCVALWSFRLFDEWYFLPQRSHTNFRWFSKWSFRWLFKLLLSLNVSLQISHWKGLSSECLFTWLFRLDLLANVFGHRWQMKGFSLVWVRIWTVILPNVLKCFKQILHSKILHPEEKRKNTICKVFFFN